MNYRTLSLPVITLLGLALLSSGGFSQDEGQPKQKQEQQKPAAPPKPLKEQILGTWSVMLVDRIASDGTRTPLYGPNPSGQLMFDSTGHFSGVLGRNNTAKFASNDPMGGTTDEDKTVLQGMIANEGKYVLNEADHTIDLRIELSSFPNWSGTKQKRSFILFGDDLTYTADAGGGNKVEIYMRRAK